MYALINCDVYDGSAVIYDKAIIIDNEKIVGLVDYNQVPPGIEVKDLGGLSVAPGFIDIQVNGGGGILFNDAPSVETIAKIASAHRKFGTTHILPTLITDNRNKVRPAIDAVQSCMNENLVPGILGIHLEGPFIEDSKAGVHDKNYIRAADNSDIDLFSSLQHGITLLTLAPEKVSDDLITALISRGVKISAGHTDATYAETKRGFELGISCSTHLFNAMSPLTGREPGAVGASLENDRSWCSVIADGYHVHFGSIKVAWHAKPKGKLFLVTDAMPPVGSDIAEFQLGELTIKVTEGRCHTSDGVLAGSGLDMATAVRNCIQEVGIPKDEALRMASTYPAIFLNIDSRLGYIKPGYQANLAIFNNQIHMSGVVIDGRYEEV